MKIQKPSTSTVLICVGLFFIFLFFTFPFQNLRGFVFSKVYANTGILVTADTIYPSLFGWPGVGAKNVTATLPLGSSELDLASERLVIRLGVGGIFPPAPLVSLSMKGLKKGGDIYARIAASKSHIAGSGETSAVELKQIELPWFPEPISGKLTADTDFYIDQTDLAKSSGHLTLEIQKLRLPPQNLMGIVFPTMSLGDVKAKLQIRNGSAEITSFQFGAPDSDLKGSLVGEMKLGGGWTTSFLNLTLRVQLSEGLSKNPQASTLLALLSTYAGKVPGEYGLKWAARVGDLATNLGTAIPQKVE